MLLLGEWIGVSAGLREELGESDETVVEVE